MTTTTNTLRLSMVLTLILGLNPVAQAECMMAVRPTSIDIFTTMDQPISGVQAIAIQLPSTHVQIHKLDGIKQLEVYLSADLPGNESRARDIALKRLGQVSKTMRRQLEQSATALAKALQHEVQQYPAIVFEGELVTYGLTDLSVALTHYRHWQRGQTP